MKEPLTTPPPPRYNSLSLLIKLALNCGLSAFYYGYCLTFFNSINFSIIIEIFHLQAYPRALTQGLLTGSTCFTAALGTLLSVQLISKYSRRQCLMILSWVILAVTGLALIPSIYTLVAVRLTQGLVIGCISCITPLYMREMMPKEVSGPLWSLHQVCFVIGTSFGFVLTLVMSWWMDPRDSWRVIFGFPMLTSTIQLICYKYFFTFDTPKWYIMAGLPNQAQHALSIIYKPQHAPHILQEITQANNYLQGHHKSRLSQMSEMYQAQIEMQQLQVQATPKLDRPYEKPTANNTLAVFTAFFLIGQQHFMGNVLTLQYAVEMTLMSFPALERSFPAALTLIGLCGSLYSIHAMRVHGRKQIILTGTLCAFGWLTLGSLIFLSYDSTSPGANPLLLRVLLLLIQVGLRLGMSIALGPVPWLYIAQIVQPNIIPYCFLLNWLMIGLISIMFPLVCSWSGGSPQLVFVVSGAVAAVSWLGNRQVMVETKGKTELEIRKEYDQKCR